MGNGHRFWGIALAAAFCGATAWASGGDVGHESEGPGQSVLINDLGVILATAAIVAILFQRLRLPVIFGYLGAGVLLGPNLFPFSPVQDLAVVQELSELGVVFLLFYIGMEFNLRRLQRVLIPASAAVMLQTIFMLVIGVGAAALAGWTSLTGLFLGCLLAISSSMVTISILRQQEKMNHPHAQNAIGILILEDILAVLLLVILTGVGVTGQLEWDSVWLTVFIMAVFVVCVFFIGRLAAPPVLNFLNRLGSLELITIAAVGLVFGVSALAQNFQFSVALGAFVAGSILSQSKLAPEIERATEPLRDIFGAVFFVTIGMLVNPVLIFQNGLWIVGISLLVVLGKTFSCWLGLFLAGEESRRSFNGSTAKAQIGEFSFIIAALGAQLGVTNEKLTAVAVGVALVTILLTPPLTRLSDRLYDCLEKLTPSPLRRLGSSYQKLLDLGQRALSKSTVLRLVRRPLLQIGSYFLIINGLLLAAILTGGYLEGTLEWPTFLYAAGGAWALAALVSVPFLVAILRNTGALVTIFLEAVIGVQTGSAGGSGRMRNLINSFLSMTILAGFGLLYILAAAPYLPGRWVLIALSILAVIIAIVFYQRMVHLNSRLEYFFLESFRQGGQTEEARRQVYLEEITTQYPWPVEVREVEIFSQSLAVGRRISQLELKEKSGTMIIALSRNNQAYYDPHPETPLFVNDRLVLIGEKEDLKRAETYLATTSPTGEEVAQPRFEIQKLPVSPGSCLEGDTLAGANLRKRFGVSVVGIQRGSERIVAPSAHEKLKANDVLLAVGPTRAMEKLAELTEPSEEEPAIA